MISCFSISRHPLWEKTSESWVIVFKSIFFERTSDDSTFQLHPLWGDIRWYEACGKEISLPGSCWFSFPPLRCDECNRTLRLMAANSLPSWWSFKFQSQDATLHGHGTTDTYNGCSLDLFLDGTCYQVFVGGTVKVFHSTESECGPWSRKQRMTYYYKYSVYGIQTYQSSESCFPLAAHQQLELEIVDVPFSSRRRQHAFLSSSMNGDCRRAVRYVVNAKKLQCHSDMNMIAAELAQRRRYLTKVLSMWVCDFDEHMTLVPHWKEEAVLKQYLGWNQHLSTAWMAPFLRNWSAPGHHRDRGTTDRGSWLKNHC